MRIALLAALCAAAVGANFAQRHPTLERPADADLKVAKAWILEKGEAGAMYVRLHGTLPLHRHPDGAHRIFVLSGRLRLTIEQETRELGPGDYAVIPIGAAHRTASLGKEPALYGTVDL